PRTRGDALGRAGTRHRASQHAPPSRALLWRTPDVSHRRSARGRGVRGAPAAVGPAMTAVSPLRTLIVDDEPMARARLKRQLALREDFVLAGEAASVADAEAVIRK